MASNTEYSQTLQHITDAKLEELSNKRQIFLKRKSAALEDAERPENALKKLRAVSDGVKTCFDVRVNDDGRVADTTHSNRHLVIELSNLDRFLNQAEYDPSISGNTLERWRRAMLSRLDVQTLKYEYATLFGQLTMEWLDVKRNPKPDDSAKSDGFENLASAAKVESRKQWEEHVFMPADCDPDAVKEFLHDLFTKPSEPDSAEASDNAKAVSKALDKLRDKVSSFETTLSGSHFNVGTLTWVINGLLASDLPTEKQRAVLREFLKDTTVLTELSDVLNMRLAALHSWSWGPEVLVQQHRQLNGSYHVRMHEDLIQAIFLQYLGAKWSVFFKSAFHNFRKMKNVWKTPRSAIPPLDRKRRAFFLGQTSHRPSLQLLRETIHRKAYFVSNLMDSETQIRNQDEGEQEADVAAASKSTKRARRVQQGPSSRGMMMQQAPMRMASYAPQMNSSARPDARLTEMEGSLENFDSYPAPGVSPDEDFDPDQCFESPLADGVMRPANQMQAKQNLLLLLSADITIAKRLYGEITCFRTQYDSLYPSLPHEVILSILRFFGVSDTWLDFFGRFLAAPLKFTDEPDSEPRLRRRGTPGAHVLSEVFGETTLFCLDFMINKTTNGESLWRINDDLWFWSRHQTTNATAWQALQKFNRTMCLPLSDDKTGGAHITTTQPGTGPPSFLPTGKIRWGMLYLNPESGCFEIDQDMVNDHIAELKRQLHDKEGSVFGWIQAWNSYASTFFTYNFGTPANCFGRGHVDMMLQTHERIQREVFLPALTSVSDTSRTGTDTEMQGTGSDKSVLAYLRETIRTRFGNTSLPDGYFFLPIDLGGLELSSPFITLLGLRDNITPTPNKPLDTFLESEQIAYDFLRRRYELKDKDQFVFGHTGFKPADIHTFMPFEEYTRHRENLDYMFANQLLNTYDELLRRPAQQVIEYDATGPVSRGLAQLQSQPGLSSIKDNWDLMTPYWKWVSQLYGPEIVELFGGFNVVDPGLLPIGLVSQFRRGRVSWREE